MGDEISEISEQYAWWRRWGAPARDEPIEAPDVYDVYARLSVNNGKKESTGRQVRDCGDLAARMRLTVGETHVDDNLSAWQPGVHRPGWEALLERIEARQIRGIIIWYIDRLLRRTDDYVRLLAAADAGLMIHSFGGGERDLNNPLHRQSLWYEIIHADSSSQDTSRRVKAGLADGAAKGRPAVGSRGYGYGVPTGVIGPNGKEIIDKRRIVPAEADEIRMAARRILAGESLSSVVQDLADRGVPTIRGGRWQIATLRGILASPRIAGLRVHGGRIVGKGAWDPIIEEPEWRQLQAALAAPRVPPQVHPDREYLLTGLAVCGRCGVRLSVQSPWEGTKKDGRGLAYHACLPAYYRCRGDAPHGGCGRNRILAEPLDRHVTARLRALSADPAALAGRDVSAARDADARELDQIERDLMELARRWGQSSGPGRMKLAEYGEARAGLAARRDELEARVAGRDRPSPEAVAGGLLWDQMDYTRRRAFARALVDAVVVAPPARRGGFDPGRISIRWR